MWKAYGRQLGLETFASIVTAAAEAHQPRSAGSCVVLLQGCNAKFWPESQLSCHHHAVLFVQKFLHSIALWKSSVSLFVPLLQKREGRMQRQYFKSEFRNQAGCSFLYSNCFFARMRRRVESDVKRKERRLEEHTARRVLKGSERCSKPLRKVKRSLKRSTRE